MSDQSPGPRKPEVDGSAGFWAELKRRKVMRVAITYAVVGWLIIQVAGLTFEGFGIPVWAFRLVTMCVILGFPVALIITWAFELTPDGIKTTKAAKETRGDAPVSEEQHRKRNRFTLLFGAAVPTLIFGALALFFYIQARNTDSEPPASDASLPATEQSIAILPLVNFSPEPENEYFAGRLDTDVRTNLTKIEDLQLVAKRTMLRVSTQDLSISEIGESLNADFIVDGLVDRIADRVRVTVSLINGRTEQEEWRSNYEREFTDEFETVSELAQVIANALLLEIMPGRVEKLVGMPTSSALAYDLYLKSISLEKTEGHTEEGMIRRREMLERAVEEDPNFVEAWALLRRVYALMRVRVGLGANDDDPGWYLAEGDDPVVVRRELDEKSEQALAKAVALDPDNVETLLSLGVDHRDREGSEQDGQERRDILRRVIREYPDNAWAWYHLAWWERHWGSEEKIIPCFEEALKRDPFNARIVETMLGFYRNTPGQEINIQPLYDRLAQIKPEVARDQRLTRPSAFGRFQGIQDAFVASADEALLVELERAWSSWIPDEGGWGSAASKTWHESLLREFRDEPDRLVELAEGSPVIEDPVIWQVHTYVDFNIVAMGIQWRRGQFAEAQAIARRTISEVGKVFDEFVDSWAGPAILLSLTCAHVILGEPDRGRGYAEQLVNRRSTSYDRDGADSMAAMAWVDPDRAADMALAEKEKDPDWDGFDQFAAYHLRYQPLIVHPKIQAYYVKEGKWIDYLAARVPEYSKYKDIDTE